MNNLHTTTETVCTNIQFNAFPDSYAKLSGCSWLLLSPPHLPLAIRLLPAQLSDTCLRPSYRPVMCKFRLRPYLTLTSVYPPPVRVLRRVMRPGVCFRHRFETLAATYRSINVDYRHKHGRRVRVDLAHVRICHMQGAPPYPYRLDPRRGRRDPSRY